MNLQIKVESFVETDLNAYGYTRHRVLIQTNVPQPKDQLIKELLSDLCYTKKEQELVKTGELPCCQFHHFLKYPLNYDLNESPNRSLRLSLRKMSKKYLGKVDKSDLREYLEKLSEDDICDIAEMVLEPESIYDDEYGTVGHVDILQIKVVDKNKSDILTIADLEANLFQAASFFYAPIEADPNASLSIGEMVTVPSGVGILN